MKFAAAKNTVPVNEIEAEAIAYGIDVHLLEHNLSLSFEERLAQHESALILRLELQRSGEAFYSKPKSPT